MTGWHGLRVLVCAALWVVLGLSGPAPGEDLPEYMRDCAGAHPSRIIDRREMWFWDRQRFGVNIFNHIPREADIQAAADLGADFIRLAVDKWPADRGAFLIGDLRDYTGLVPKDLERLDRVLDWAEEAGIPVVLTMLQLPGAPWPQLHGRDARQALWREADYWHQSMRFWRDLARHLSGRSIVVGYNILNEPRPEQATGQKDLRGKPYARWAREARQTTADLNQFYACVVDAIRQGDQITPIVLDAGIFASLNGLQTLVPVQDPLTLYAVHSYYPSEYTRAGENKGRYDYPGRVRVDGRKRMVDRDALRDYWRQLEVWAKTHDLEAERVLVGEVGVTRTVAGAEDYLVDTLAILTEAGWHWAVYSFREDRWHDMDYELGATELPDLADRTSDRARQLDGLRRRDAHFQRLWEFFE
jgi:hypothetical protein